MRLHIKSDPIPPGESLRGTGPLSVHRKQEIRIDLCSYLKAYAASIAAQLLGALTWHFFKGTTGAFRIQITRTSSFSCLIKYGWTRLKKTIWYDLGTFRYVFDPEKERIQKGRAVKTLDQRSLDPGNEATDGGRSSDSSTAKLRASIGTAQLAG